MITGFNTDIKHEGTTYHVQTEDKGLETPLILSLVYDRGTILASKRSPYEDLIADKFDEKVLAERLQKQHSLICAAIRAGRIEDLKRMTMKESASKQKVLIAQKEIKPPVPEKDFEVSFEKKKNLEPEIIEHKKPEAVKIAESVKITESVQTGGKISTPNFPENREIKIPEREIPVLKKPAFITPKDEKPASVKIIEQIEARTSKKPKEEVWDIPIKIIEEPIIEAVQIIEEELILPAEAVEILSESAKNDANDSSKLNIRMLENSEFKGGERKTIKISVNRGNAKSGLSGAHILIKILGSAFRPLIFHSKTDSNGIAVVHLQLPRFKNGRAAVLIKAMSDGEEIEMRRTIIPN